MKSTGHLRIHNDRVITPFLRDWKIDQLTGLTAQAREVQQAIMELPAKVLCRAEAFERRFGMAT